MHVALRPQGFHRLCWLLTLVWLGLAATRGDAASGTLGDRVVLAINNVPYTQRQVEVYLTVRESLRKSNDGATRLIDERNWREALDVFTENMIILQEAQRLGSFAAPDQLLDKYSAMIKDKIARGPALRQTLARLGADEQTLGRTLDSVLRVDAFRRSKDRQENQSSTAKRTPGVSSKWLVELVGRSIVRELEGARTYEVIQPMLGRTGDGP